MSLVKIDESPFSIKGATQKPVTLHQPRRVLAQDLMPMPGVSRLPEEAQRLIEEQTRQIEMLLRNIDDQHKFIEQLKGHLREDVTVTEEELQQPNAAAYSQSSLQNGGESSVIPKHKVIKIKKSTEPFTIEENKYI